jgi:hypothetical protein
MRPPSSGSADETYEHYEEHLPDLWAASGA